MNDDRYRDNQTRHQRDRDLGCVGDQDVLSALVGSAQFADVPVKLLQSGRDVVQNLGEFGWHPRDRLRSMLSGSPPLVHALGPKPWTFNGPLSSEAAGQAKHDAFAAEFSIYGLVATRFAELAGVRPRADALAKGSLNAWSPPASA